MDTHLKLEHLAPYLPYGLNLFYESKFCEENFTSIDRLTIININMCLIGNHKPILRPLSDLTKEEGLKISSNGIFYKDDGFMIWSKSNDCYTRLNAMQTPYWFNLLMFEHHFDVFGLIEKGSAIDINTLEK